MKPGISLIRYWGGLAAFMLVPAILGFLSTGCSPSLSLQELKDKIAEIEKSDGVVTQRSLYAAIGKPSKEQSVGGDVYLYYSVKEGMAQIIAFGPAWEGKAPKKVLIKGAGPAPDMPKNITKWYLDRGGANPFSTKEENVDDMYHARVIVLRDGKADETYTVAAYGYNSPAYVNCTVTHHVWRHDGKEQPPPGDGRSIGYFAIRDQSGTLITHVPYELDSLWTGSRTDGTYGADIASPEIQAKARPIAVEFYKAKLEAKREEAGKKAEAGAAEYRKLYKENVDTFQRNLTTARKEAAECVQRNLEKLAQSEWDKFGSEWYKKNTRILDEPWLALKAVNQY